MAFTDVYCIPGIGKLIHEFLEVDDFLRLDTTCKAIKAHNDTEILPSYKRVDMDAIMNMATDPFAAGAFLGKVSKHVEHIESTYNVDRIRLPPAKTLPRLRTLRYAIPLGIDITGHVIDRETLDLWTNVETFMREVAQIENHPLESAEFVPGEIALVRRDRLTRVSTSVKWIPDRNETTHQEYYRYFMMPSIYIPLALNCTICLPDPLIWGDVDDHPNVLTWNWDCGDSIGKMMLDVMTRGDDDSDDPWRAEF